MALCNTSVGQLLSGDGDASHALSYIVCNTIEPRVGVSHQGKTPPPLSPPHILNISLSP